MPPRAVSATPRRSTRSQSREVESRAASPGTEEAGSSVASSSSSAIEPSASKTTTAKRGRRTTKSTSRQSVSSRVNGNGSAEEQAVLSTTIVEEEASELDQDALSQPFVSDETIVAETSTPKAETKRRKSKVDGTPARQPLEDIIQPAPTNGDIQEHQSPIVTLPQRRRARQKLISLIQRASIVAAHLPGMLLLAACLLFIALPSPEKPFQRNVYVDENALQPGSANIEFSWADVEFADKVAARIQGVVSMSPEIRAAFLSRELKDLGYTPHNQTFAFDLPKDAHRRETTLTGINTYARWPAARGDGKEAFVISTSWKSSWDGRDDPEQEQEVTASSSTDTRRDGSKTLYEQNLYRKDNVRGIATALAIARHLIAYRQWSKDLIFVFADGELEGMQAWTSSFFGRQQSNLRSDPLPGRGALLWNALSIDYPSDSFSHIEIRHEGLDGQLPNLDVISTLDELMYRAGNVPLVLPASSEDDVADQPLGKIGDLLNKHVWSSKGAARAYVSNLRNLLRQTGLQSACHPSGSHGLFHKYHVDAITIFARPAKGPHGFHSMGKMVESMTRSMSNLLERLHHSHFFYMLTSPQHFVEVAKYLPVASMLSAALLLSAIAIWLQEGRAARQRREEVISAVEDVVLDELDELVEGPHDYVNGNADAALRARDPSDAALQFATSIQTTQKLISILVQRSERRGDLVGSAKIRIMSALLQSQGRPMSTALGVAAASHVIGLFLFWSFTSAPIDCARHGLSQCRPLRLSAVLILVTVLTVLVLACRRMGMRFARCLVAMQALLPEDSLAVLLPLRHAEQRAVARMVLMIAMLEAGIVTLIVSIVNFGLAAVLGALLAPALCSIRLCISSSRTAKQDAKLEQRNAMMRQMSPASDDSDVVDAMLPVREPSSAFGIVSLSTPARLRLGLHGIVLLALLPPPLLFLAKRLALLGNHALSTPTIARHLPFSYVSPVLVERLVDGALWDYHVLASILLPLLCGSYIPIVVMGALACLLMASASNATAL